jgi:hypothetical protein
MFESGHIMLLVKNNAKCLTVAGLMACGTLGHLAFILVCSGPATRVLLPLWGWLGGGWIQVLGYRC